MTIRIAILAAGLLLALGGRLAAQERAVPPEPPGPPFERIERLRLERLQEALDLTDEQTETLRQQMERTHEAMRASFARQQEAIEALEQSLATRPPDEDALRRALADVESAREAMEREREQHTAELGRTLTLEQRAKFLLFNRHFDTRLRELVEQHGGRGVRDHRGPAPRRDEMRGGDSREERIAALEREIREMQEELAELKSGAED